MATAKTLNPETAGDAIIVPSGQTSTAAAAPVAVSAKPVVIYIMSRYCSGCEYVHEHVLPKPQVQAALKGVEFQTFDTATPQGAAMAAKHRIDVTPTLLGFDRYDRLVFQSNEVLEENNVLEVLQSLDAD